MNHIHQKNNVKYFCLCADDYGLYSNINHAIIKLIENQRIHAVSCMTTMPLWQTEAQHLQKFIGEIDIGLHFNLTEYTSQHETFSLPKIIWQAYTKQLNQKKIEKIFAQQIVAFKLQLNHLPDFIDGHQHIQQLPIIRDAIINVYQQYYKNHKAYMRVSANFNKNNTNPFNMKAWIIRSLGGNTWLNLLKTNSIPYNAAFAGIYKYQPKQNFQSIMQSFLQNYPDKTLIMCHPAVSQAQDDPIKYNRNNEYDYLISEQFSRDCELANVNLLPLSRVL